MESYVVYSNIIFTRFYIGALPIEYVRKINGPYKFPEDRVCRQELDPVWSL